MRTSRLTWQENSSSQAFVTGTVKLRLSAPGSANFQEMTPTTQPPRPNQRPHGTRRSSDACRFDSARYRHARPSAP